LGIKVAEENKNDLDGLAIALVPSNLIDIVWPQVAVILDRVVEKAPDDLVPSVVYDQLQSGFSTLMIISRGPKVIAINVFDIKILDSGIRTMYVPITAGDEMETWLGPAHEIAIQIAKHHGCKELRGIATRKGWMHKLKPLGWEELFMTIRCPIGE
jgi:hypothetical protein